ncbi:MAG: S8 family peptidase, partial [Gammaproteobacteria bacterium]
MTAKAFSRPMTLALILALIGSTYVSANQTAVNLKKLGFGFEPGLVPGTDYVPGQLIVGYKAGFSTRSISRTASSFGGRKIKEVKGTAMLLQFASEADVDAAAPSLLAAGNVLFVERNGIVRLPPEPRFPQLQKRPASEAASDIRIRSVSADAGTGYQWHHTVIRKTAALPALSTTPPTVAVIDSGVDYTHPDLAGKVFLGRNVVAGNFDPYDDASHGTHVAGIIAAKAGNGGYGEGICPNCRILAVKVLDSAGEGTNFDVAVGMHYAHTVATSPPTRVFNLSLGGPASAMVATEVDHIKAEGKIVVAAAGNDNTTDSFFAFPAADPDTALRVMSTENNDCRSRFSNFSPSTSPTQYNIAAPGSEIYSTLPNAGYSTLSGTSFASPMVAAAA